MRLEALTVIIALKKSLSAVVATVIADFSNNPRGAVATECLRDNTLPGFLLPEGTISRQ